MLTTHTHSRRKFDWQGNVTEERSLGDGGTTVADRVITTTYDGASRIERIQDSEGGETWNEVLDGRGNVVQQKVKLTSTPTWAQTNFVYDALNRTVQITDPQDHDGL